MKNTLIAIIISVPFVGTTIGDVFMSENSKKTNLNQYTTHPSMTIPMQIPEECQSDSIILRYIIEEGKSRFYLTCNDIKGDVHTYLADKNGRSIFEERIIKKSFYTQK